MKMNKEVVDNRRKIIMQKIQTNGTVTVDELAQELNVAPMTIRRDLQYWEEKELWYVFTAVPDLCRPLWKTEKIIMKPTNMPLPNMLHSL